MLLGFALCDTTIIFISEWRQKMAREDAVEVQFESYRKTCSRNDVKCKIFNLVWISPNKLNTAPKETRIKEKEKEDRKRFSVQ